MGLKGIIALEDLQELTKIKALMQKSKKAGYQEKLINELVEDILKLCK